MGTCYQCGTCTADCPVARHAEFNPRKLMLEPDGKLSWLCATCFKCYRCPKDVKPYEVLAEFRSRDVKEGSYPAYVRAFVDVVKNYGELDEAALFMRLLRSGKIMDISLILAALRMRRVSLPVKSECASEVRRIFEVVGNA
ncbi:4Fe-4S dicluster domain-containing protein [Archaeoglobus veneficus]|nr:4Fe-4S dicluster domain-containing protein [Archaeoglobus veneficus]